MVELIPEFALELQKYGAKDFDACYNCGNCTAVCNLTEKQANFPRMSIRYGMIGLQEDILNSKELWLCYACGDCSETCPRQANPGEYMAALRRFAIAKYDPTGLTGLIFKNNPFSIVVTMIIAVILGFFVFTIKPDHEVSRWIFNLMPFDVIHDMGMIIFIFAGITLVVGLLKMFFHLRKIMQKDSKNNKSKQNGFFGAMKKVSLELALMKRYRDCDADEASFWFRKPWFLKPWFVHWSIMWGFLGLLLATILDFIFKDPALTVWWPSRILGTVTGLLMMYGATLAIIYRIQKPTKTYEDTKLADWIFLVFLWLAGLTGFWMEIAVTFGGDLTINQIVFIIHTIISMELVLLFAFSKFAHAMYRPLALFLHFMKN